MGSRPTHKHWLGLDIGGTKILGAVVSDDLEILGTSRVETLRDEGPRAVAERAVSLLRGLIEAHGPANGVGAGFAGLVDWKTGVVSSSIMLPGWDGFPLASFLSESLGGLPAFADNDATVAGYGEYLALGAPPGLNMVLLTVGTGIGGAILIDGRLYRGATGTSAEFGNMTIDWLGTKCWCGNRGCLNMLASGSAISVRAAVLADEGERGALDGLDRPISVEKIAEAARSGDPDATQALDEGARALGAGVASIINIFNPDLVVLTGGVSVLGEDYLDRVRKEAAWRAFKENADHARIELSVVGTEAGVLGAAGLVRDHCRNR